MSQRLWSELTSQLEPYTPGEQPQVPDLLKLNTNESPYAPSEHVLAAIRGVNGEDLLRYPDPTAQVLRNSIAQYYGLTAEQVFVGNGSDEVLSHVFLGLLKQHRELLFPDISYSFYPVWCQLHGIHYRQVPLRDDFTIDPADYSASASAVIFPNPNAPTGRLLDLSVIRRFLEDAPQRLLVVDEAYIDYGGESAVALLADYDNLLIVQTLSKSRALAGLRVGLALGSESIVQALVRIKDSFNSYPLDVVAQRAATAAFEDGAWFQETCRRVAESRSTLQSALESMGFEVLPSAANFLFVKHLEIPGETLFSALRQRGIIVRRWDRERIRDYLRISIGTDAQCQRLVTAFGEILST